MTPAETRPVPAWAMAAPTCVVAGVLAAVVALGPILAPCGADDGTHTARCAAVAKVHRHA